TSLYQLLTITTTAPPRIYTLSLHDALPIWTHAGTSGLAVGEWRREGTREHDGLPVRDDASTESACEASQDEQDRLGASRAHGERSEEHTSELQSRGHLVCRLLLEKKKRKML